MTNIEAKCKKSFKSIFGPFGFEPNLPTKYDFFTALNCFYKQGKKQKESFLLLYPLSYNSPFGGEKEGIEPPTDNLKRSISFLRHLLFLLFLRMFILYNKGEN